MKGALTFTKKERICARSQMERLFTGGNSHSMTSYPIRAVFCNVERTEYEPQVQILVSVPKKHFKRAVKRNRVKRQMREAYRKNKHILIERQPAGHGIDIAFTWIADELFPTQLVEKRIVNLLERISEKS